jgi:hypothetical protein
MTLLSRIQQTHFFVYKLHSYLNHSIETNAQIVKRIVLRYVGTNNVKGLLRL